MQPFGVRSVIGFGDVLPDGNMFALICFCKVPVTQASAELLSHLSLSTRVAILPHMRTLADPMAEITQSQEHLLVNYEEIVIQQQQVPQLALSETRRANELKGEFLANMSHEIRTPMTAILGFSDMLSNDIDFVRDESEARAAVQTIYRNASHLLTIINDILDMSKIDTGKMEVELMQVDPLQILEEAVSFVRPQAIAKRLNVAVDSLTPIPQKIQTELLGGRLTIRSEFGSGSTFSLTINSSYQESL